MHDFGVRQALAVLFALALDQLACAVPYSMLDCLHVALTNWQFSLTLNCASGDRCGLLDQLSVRLFSPKIFINRVVSAMRSGVAIGPVGVRRIVFSAVLQSPPLLQSALFLQRVTTRGLLHYGCFFF
jgi:hypothetical protein